VRRDRHLSRDLEAFAREEVRNRRRLAAQAAGPGAGAALVSAFADVDVYRSLRREGFSTADAADQVAAALNLALDAMPGAGRRQ
jgi:hypothetical protein